jgi:peptidylprolyl isomerase
MRRNSILLPALLAAACLGKEAKAPAKVQPLGADAAASAFGQPIPAPLDVKAPPADAESAPSGLRWRVLAKGNGGQHPQRHDLVEVHYTGWTAAGTMFDSSVARAARAQFSLDSAIPGWAEALATMVPGEKRRLWVPPALAYGDRPEGRSPPGMLVFDLELLAVIKMPMPPEVPTDLKAPPPQARRTKSGLAYLVLRPGNGGARARSGSAVEINYSGWSSVDGELFDSSGGQPVMMPMARLTSSLREAVGQMSPGEKTRFWVPKAVAARQAMPPEASPGMLVYEVELLSLK